VGVSIYGEPISKFEVGTSLVLMAVSRKRRTWLNSLHRKFVSWGKEIEEREERRRKLEGTVGVIEEFSIE